MADKAFERVHAWFVQAVDRSLADVADPGQRDALRCARSSGALPDPVNRNVAPPPASASAFH